MKKIYPLLLSLSLLVFSCQQNFQPNKGDNSNDGTNHQMTYQEKVQSIKETERANPLQFLRTDSVRYRKDGIFFIDYYADFVITNNASAAEYKDAVIQISFFSKTNTQLSSVSHTYYEYYTPHSTKSFSYKVNPPRDCEKISVSVVGATPL